MIVSLTSIERRMAHLVGNARHSESRNLGAGQQALAGQTNFRTGADRDILGAARELAAAKATRRYWMATTMDTRGSPDIAGADVRGRVMRGRLVELFIKASDAPTRPVILVQFEPAGAIYHVVGWCYGNEGETLGEPTDKTRYEKAWYVPPDRLRDLADLPPI